MDRLIIYRALMYGACGYALFRGKTDSRIVAAVFIVGDLATLALRSSSYSSVEISILAIDILGFIGDFGAGGMYIVCRALELGHGVVAHATADYGTKFIIVSGLLNFISVADAYHIAIGKKP